MLAIYPNCFTLYCLVTSLDSSELLDESENIYENCAVVASHSAVTPSEDVESMWHEK